MSRVLSLALKITGDASGVRLNPVERALKRLGEETDKVGKVFDKFAKDSDAGSRAQAQFANESQRLTESLKSGAINGREYAEQFAKLAESANKEAAALERAAQLTAKFEPEAQKFARTQAELNEQVSKGRITQEVYNAAIESAARNLTGAERAAAGLAARTADVAKSGERSTLQFRELSGIFAVLPGSLGNIAGRISGITSASEGLSRIFSGGLQQGAASLVRSFAGLVNPLTAGVGALVAFGAAARNVATGLIALEDRVERLGNTADKLGVSFEFVQVLEDAAKRSGTSIDAVSAAFGRLQKSILSTDEESKTAQKALSSLRIEFEDLQRLSPEEQYRLIGERLAAIENPARRTATATALFGRAGAELLPFFRNLPKAASDLESVGAALNEQQRARVDRFGEAMDRLATASQGAGQQLREAFTDLGTIIAQNLAEATGAVAKFLQQQNEFNRQTAEFKKLRQEIASVQAGPITQAQEAAIRAGETAEQVLARARGVAQELREELEEPADPAFLKSLDDIAKKVEDAKLQSVDFGQAGFDAAVQFEEAINALKEKLDSGLFNEETFKREAEKARVAFREQLDQISEESLLEIKIEQDAAATLEQLRQQISDVIDDSERFGEVGFDAAVQFQGALEELRRQFEAGIINEETLAREAKKAREEYEGQARALEDATRAQQDQIENDRKRIDSLLGVSDAASRAAQDVAAIEREIARVQSEVNAAGGAASPELEARLAQLEDLQQAVSQGFGEGFDKAFEATAKGFDSVIEKAAEFGKAGFDAAAQLQEGIALAQEQARDGILNREAYEQEVARQQELFDKQLADIKALADERQRINEFVDNQLELARFGGDQQRLQASKNVAALEAEIGRVQQEIQAARAAGDNQAVQAAVQRLAQLDQVAAKERDVASGRLKAEAEIAKQRDEFLKAEQQRQQQIAQARRQAQEQQARAAAAEADRQEKRIRALNSIGQQSIGGADIRTSQGASQFVQAAAGAFDPNLAQQRAQTKLLQKIATNSGALQFLERGIGQSVAILRGGA